MLTRATDLGSSDMRLIVGKLDAAWVVYQELNGRIPTTINDATWNGLSTIAEVPDGATCGAGCAHVGLTGIEISSSSWDVFYSGVKKNNLYDQVLFMNWGEISGFTMINLRKSVRL